MQYGCGFNAPSGWKNFDVSPTLRFERLPLIGRLYSKNQQRFPENVEYGDQMAGCFVSLYQTWRFWPDDTLSRTIPRQPGLSWKGRVLGFQKGKEGCVD